MQQIKIYRVESIYRILNNEKIIVNMINIYVNSNFQNINNSEKKKPRNIIPPSIHILYPKNYIINLMIMI